MVIASLVVIFHRLAGVVSQPLPQPLMFAQYSCILMCDKILSGTYLRHEAYGPHVSTYYMQ